MLRQVTRWFVALIALTLIAIALLVSNVLSTYAAGPSHTSAPVHHAVQHHVAAPQTLPNVLWGGY